MEQTRLRYTPKDQPVSCQRVDRTSDYTPRFIHMHASHELCFVSGKSQFEVFSGGRTAAVQAPALIFHRNHCYHELLRILPGTIYYSTVAHFLPETLPLPTALQAWDCVILPLSTQEEENFSRYFTLLPNEPTERQVLIIQLILSCNNIVNAGFDQIFMLYSALVYDVADIIDTYVYRIGIQKADYSFSTAANMFKSIIALIMILIVNTVAKKTGNEGIW